MKWPAATDIIVILFQAVLTIAAIVVQWLSTAEDRRTRPALLVRVCAITTALGLAVVSLYRAGKQAFEIADTRTQMQDLRQGVDAIRAFQGDADLLKKYLALHHEMNQASSTGDADGAVEQLLKDLPARRTEHLSRTEQAQRLVNELRVKIDPVVDALVTAFDSRMDALRRQAVNVEEQRDEVPAITVADSSVWKRLRVVQLPGSSVEVLIKPGFVNDSGRFSGVVFVEINYRSATGPAAPMITLGLSEGSADLHGTLADRILSKLDDPAEGASLRKAMRDAVDRLVAKMLVAQPEGPETR